MGYQIKIDKKVGNRWEPIKVSTKEFANLRNNPNYKIREDSFEEFRNHDTFLKDTIQAISNENFGPSFVKFKESLINGRALTNIGTYRAYIKAYLKNNSHIHDNMTFLVRQLSPTENGLPIQIYVFSNNTNWIDYEGIQSDIEPIPRSIPFCLSPYWATC